MQLDRVDQLFRAFSDETRLRILNVLRDGELCVGDLVRVLGVPQPTASRHLGQLRDAGLVRTRRQGLWCFYTLAEADSRFHRRLLGCLASCFDEVPELAADLVAAKELRVRGGCCPETVASAPRQGSRRRP
jgi:ArsR family transcriptional regulator